MHRIFAVALFFVLLLPTPVFALTPNDTFYSDLWYLPRVQAPDAWDTTVGSQSVVVAVLDAGVDLDHPDLARNIWVNVNEIPANEIDDDDNGFVDDVYGWDFEDGDNNPSPVLNSISTNDALDHGSVVAGIIGAVGNNGRGLTGVAWDVRIMSVRMLDEVGSGSSYSTVKAIEYAVANGADVINLSFAGEVEDLALKDAIQQAHDAGVVIVAALGNDSIDSDKMPIYPACYGIGSVDDAVIGVASTGRSDETSEFTNFGSICTDLSAPGEEIYGLKYHDPTGGYPDQYGGFWSGTSMAAPIVSGAAALLLSKYPTLTPNDIQTILQLSVDPIVVLGEKQGKLGAGRVNIARALEIAVNFTDPVPDLSPVIKDPDVESSQTSASLSTDYISGESFQTVYAITEDGKRLVFIDAATYFTYEDSFDQIQIVPDKELSNYPLGGVVLPKAGVVLVKIQSGPSVYIAEQNPLDAYSPFLRKISDENVAISMFGINWSDYVIDVEPSFFNKFTIGQDVLSPESVDTSIMKTRQELAQLSN